MVNYFAATPSAVVGFTGFGSEPPRNPCVRGRRKTSAFEGMFTFLFFPSAAAALLYMVCEELLVAAHESGDHHVWWIDLQVHPFATPAPAPRRCSPRLASCPSSRRARSRMGSSLFSSAFPCGSLYAHSFPLNMCARCMPDSSPASAGLHGVHVFTGAQQGVYDARRDQRRARPGLAAPPLVADGRRLRRRDAISPVSGSPGRATGSWPTQSQ